MTLRSSIYGWKSVWMDLADESKGEFIDGKVAVLRIPVHPLTITFRMHASPVATKSETTSIVVPFHGKGDFKFSIHNKSWVDDAAKPFGLQDIVVGHDDFDHEFIIKSNDDRRVKEYFNDEALRQHIMNQKHVRLALHKEGQLSQYGKVPEHVHVLSFNEHGAISSFERMVSLVELMKANVKRLHELDHALMQEPDFVL